MGGQRSAAEVKVKEVKVGAWLNRFRFARGPDAPFRRVGIQEGGEPLRSVQCVGWLILFKLSRPIGAELTIESRNVRICADQRNEHTTNSTTPLHCGETAVWYGNARVPLFFYCRWGMPSVERRGAEPPFASVVATECQNAGGLGRVSSLRGGERCAHCNECLEHLFLRNMSAGQSVKRVLVREQTERLFTGDCCSSFSTPFFIVFLPPISRGGSQPPVLPCCVAWMWPHPVLILSIVS